MKVRFRGNLIIRGELKCETALHIGGSVEGYEIGGMDNPVIKDAITGYPYIPGSSLKGKLRSLLEWAKDKVEADGKIHSCDNPDCPVCRIFGVPAEEGREIGPTRLIVRDVWPTEGTKRMLDELQRTKGLPKVEWKWENSINRITSEATPRPIERVPRDSVFNFEMVFSLYDFENSDGNVPKPDLEFLGDLIESLQLLEDTYLGGLGSRGSGKVKFYVKQFVLKTLSDYESQSEGKSLLDTEGQKVELRSLNVKELIDEINKRFEARQ